MPDTYFGKRIADFRIVDHAAGVSVFAARREEYPYDCQDYLLGRYCECSIPHIVQSVFAKGRS